MRFVKIVAAKGITGNLVPFKIILPIVVKLGARNIHK
jgi:hypothetical protein